MLKFLYSNGWFTLAIPDATVSPPFLISKSVSQLSTAAASIINRLKAVDVNLVIIADFFGYGTGHVVILLSVQITRRHFYPHRG